jgi:hypothetical protein
MEINSSIGTLVRKAEQDFITGNIQVSKYVNENFYEDINTIEAYLNSKHISGPTDSLNREKPFFNIVLAARNIWVKATDLDRKNIRAKASKAKDELASFLFTMHLQKWMKDDNFGKFLNDWGIQLASFNSAVCKFVEKKDGLHCMVMDWNKIIVDVVDFDSNPRIEILELTPAQLRKRKDYDQEMVEKLITESKTTRKNPDSMAKDLKSDFIRIYEVHGELPLSYLTDNEKDETEYVQQMHVISFTTNKENKKDFNDYTLYSGREKQDPYLLTWLMPNVDGSISLSGAVKTLIEAQWMVNHSIKAIKDQLDLASQLVFQTSDGNFVGQNFLSEITTGQILIHKENQPLQQVANNSHDISALQSFGQQWQNIAQEISSTPDAMMGKQPPSGTAYRQTALVQQQASSNFDIMVQNKGLFIEEMMRKYITPYVLKQMDTNEEISATLDAYGIDKIDQMYIGYQAVKNFNEKAVQAVLNEEPMPNLEQETANVKSQLNQQSSTRYLKPSDISTKTWKEVIGDFEANVEYEITGENKDKQAVLTTLTTLLQTIAGNPMVLQDPNAKIVFNKILEETGEINPLELSNSPTPQMAQSAPQMGGGIVGVGGQKQANAF